MKAYGPNVSSQCSARGPGIENSSMTCVWTAGSLRKSKCSRPSTSRSFHARRYHHRFQRVAQKVDKSLRSPPGHARESLTDRLPPGYRRPFFAHYGPKRAIDSEVVESETVAEILRSLYDKITLAVSSAKTAIVELDEIAAQNILHLKDEINQLVYQMVKLQAQRLKTEGADDIQITMFENELLDSMKRIYTLTKRLARLTLPGTLFEELA